MFAHPVGIALKPYYLLPLFIIFIFSNTGLPKVDDHRPHRMVTGRKENVAWSDIAVDDAELSKLFCSFQKRVYAVRLAETAFEST